jgi:hypothetical protein
MLQLENVLIYLKFTERGQNVLAMGPSCGINCHYTSLSFSLPSFVACTRLLAVHLQFFSYIFQLHSHRSLVHEILLFSLNVVLRLQLIISDSPRETTSHAVVEN